MDKEEEKGLFWLPDNADEKVKGVFTRADDGGTVLTTYGQLGQCGSEVRPQQVIQGVIANTYIKLVNCVATNHRMDIDGLSGADETTWYCPLAFRGGDYSGNVPNRIKSVEVTIELLGDWTSGFEGIKLSEDGLSLSWPANQPDQAARWDLGEVAVHQEILRSWNATRFAVEHAAVRVHTSTRVTFHESQPWLTVMHTVLCLQALVSIAKGEAVHVERTSIVEEGTPDVGLGASYRRVLHRGTQQIPHSELFTMEELGGVQGMAQWLNVLRDQESLVPALLVDRYRQPAFITDRTSHLLAACEAYHRHRMANPNRWIRNLRKTVLDPLLHRAGRPFEEWIGDLEAWKDTVNDVRINYGVAHLQGYASHVLGRPDFHSINQQLYLLVVSCLLADCEVSEDVRSKVVERMRSLWKMRL